MVFTPKFGWGFRVSPAFFHEMSPVALLKGRILHGGLIASAAVVARTSSSRGILYSSWCLKRQIDGVRQLRLGPDFGDAMQCYI